MPKVRHVIGFDFDGCLGGYSQKFVFTINKLVSLHAKLWQWLQKLQADHDKATFLEYLCASTRNSLTDELYNVQEGKAPAFPIFHRLEKEAAEMLGLRLKFNPYLLTDTIQGRTVDNLQLVCKPPLCRQPGDSFQKLAELTHGFQKSYIEAFGGPLAMKQYGSILQQHGYHETTYTDSKKIFLLFAEAHHLASQAAPEEVIHYHFVDDMYAKAAYNFYRHHPELLPPNLVLHFVKYDADFDLDHKCASTWIKQDQGFEVIEEGVVHGSAILLICTSWQEILLNLKQNLSRQGIDCLDREALTDDKIAKGFEQAVQAVKETLKESDAKVSILTKAVSIAKAATSIAWLRSPIFSKAAPEKIAIAKAQEDLEPGSASSAPGCS